jgi:hypothetical protein
MRRWIAVLLIFVCSVVSAQLPQPVANAVTQVVKVSVPDAGGGFSVGSGTYLGDGLYLTAWHVLRDGRQGVPTTLSWSDGKVFQAKLVGSDPNYDIAILESSDKPRGGVPLASENLSIGKPVYFAGYSSGSLQPWDARVTAYCSPAGGGSSDWIRATGSRPSNSGDSGGPVFNENGCYVGCLWGGSAPAATVANNCGRTQRFLFPWNARLAAWQSQGYGCQPGYCPPQQPQQSGPGQREVLYGGGSTPTQPQGNLGWPSTPQPQPDAGEVSTEQLAAMAAAITQQLREDPSLRGERGPQGPAGKDGERGPAGPGISDISMDGEGYVYVQYGANGRREQIGRLQLPEQSAGERSPAYFEIVPKR